MRKPVKVGQARHELGEKFGPAFGCRIDLASVARAIGPRGERRAQHADRAQRIDGCRIDRLARHTRSKIAAMPWPPPMHIVTRAKRPPMRCSSYSALMVMIVPVAPTG